MVDISRDIDGVVSISEATFGLHPPAQGPESEGFVRQVASIQWSLLKRTNIYFFDIDFERLDEGSKRSEEVHLAVLVLKECMNAQLSNDSEGAKGMYMSILALQAIQMVHEYSEWAMDMDRVEWEWAVERVLLKVLSSQEVLVRSTAFLEMVVDSIAPKIVGGGSACSSLACWNVAKNVLACVSRVEQEGVDIRYELIPSEVGVYISSICVKRAVETRMSDEKAGRNSCGELIGFLECSSGQAFCQIVDLVKKQKRRDEAPPLSLMKAIVESCREYDENVYVSLLRQVWDLCTYLWKEGKAAEEISILVQYVNAMVASGSVLSYDDRHVWDLLYWSLLSNKNVVKKRGLFVLERMVQGMPEAMAVRWQRFIQVYLGLDDTSLHLFKENWKEIDHLHPEDDSVERLPFKFIEMAWMLGIRHSQTTCQKLALVTFLTRKWSTQDLTLLKKGFLKDVLIPVLGQSSVYRGAHGEEIEQHLDGFFQQWSAAVLEEGDDSFCELVSCFLEVFYGKKQQHTSMLVCARLLKVMSTASDRQSIQASPGFMEKVVQASESQKVYGSNHVAITCYESLFVLCAKTMRIGSAKEDVWLLLKWLSPIPKGLIQPAGTLHECAVKALENIVKKDEVMASFSGLYGDFCDLDFADRANIKIFNAAAKALMLISSFHPGILEALQGWKSFECTMTSYGECWMLSSILDMVLPLKEGNTVGPTAFNEYIWGQRGQFQRLLIHITDNITSQIREKISPGEIEAMYAHCHEQAGLQHQEKDLEGASLEPYLPYSFRQFRETIVLSAKVLRQSIQILIMQNAREDLRNISNLLQEAAETLVMKYKEILVVHEYQHLKPHLRDLCFYEDAILLLRLVEGLGECLRLVLDKEDYSCGKLSRLRVDILDLCLGNLETFHCRDSTRGNIISHTEVLSSKEIRKTSKSMKAPTVKDWFTLCSWRVIDVYLTASELSNVSIARMIGYAISDLQSIPDGSNKIIPIIHCLRSIIPVTLKNDSVSTQCRQVFCELGWEDMQPEWWTRNNIVSLIGRSLLEVLKGQSRKKTGISAAVLTTIVHPDLFSPSMLEIDYVMEMHKIGGSINSLVKDAVELGQRFNRLLVQISCHLGALLARAPCLGIHYSDILQDLCLVAFTNDSSFLTLRDEILDSVTAAETSFVLTSVPPEIARTYAQTECAPRIATLCLLHHWVESGINGDVESEKSAIFMWQKLYNFSCTDQDVSQTCYIHYGSVHKKKVRVWQALTILAPIIPDKDIESSFENIMQAMDSPNAATVKQYQEIIAASLVLRKPELIRNAIFPAISDYTSQRKEANTSFFAILGTVIMHLDPDADIMKKESNTMATSAWKSLLLDCCENLLPWFGAFPHANRTFAQLVLWKLITVYPWVVEEKPYLRKLQSFFETNTDLHRLKKSLGTATEHFNIYEAVRPTGILCTGDSIMGRAQQSQMIENAPLPMVFALQEYLSSQVQDTRQRIQENTKKASAMDFDIGIEESVKSSKGFWQRKITPLDQTSAALVDPWKVALGTSSLSNAQQYSGNSSAIDTFESNLDNENMKKEYRQDIIVVASLIDRVPNLAGITRTCEIFRAAKLVVRDLSVQNDPDFASISVSANSWMPLEEVSPENLASYLQMMRARGYKLVGLEQTEKSVLLPEYSFDASKTLLILGAEKEGIPADILELLEDTIEIPQLGVIRSLNVHVSAAITLYEYTRQHQARKP